MTALTNCPISPAMARIAYGNFCLWILQHLGRLIPEAPVMLTLVLNSVQKGGDEFRLKDYGRIEVLPYC